MFWKLVGLSILNFAESEECNVWTGGYCNWGILGCPETSSCIAVGTEKKCGCYGQNEKGERTQGCWKNGQCQNMQVAAQFSDVACQDSYTDRCYELPPYSFSGHNCCGKCGDGESKPVCHWSYTETQPALTLSGDFPLDSNECRDACDALNTAGNTRAFYCGHAVDACGPAKQSVHDAIRRTPGVTKWQDFCNSDGQSEVECAWHHKRGRTEDKDCGDRVYDDIQGLFRYKTSDYACKSACEALGAMTKTPADFCNIDSIVRKCEAAYKSINNVPGDWCQDKFSGSVPSPAPNNDKLCHDAYRAGCWATGAFKSCCGECTKDEGELTCHWSFAGPPNLLGDAHICGQEISGQFAIENEACYNACNYLSHDVKATTDLCTANLDTTVNMCGEARRSVLAAVGSTNWCGNPMDMLNLESTMLANDDAICQAAYEQRCFEREPFKQCCAQCSSGNDDHTCHWTYEETNPHFSGQGSFVGSGVCVQVCQALNAGSSQTGAFARYDYCPGGALYNLAQQCAGAKTSLAAVFTSAVCKHEDNSRAQCDWRFSYDTKDAQSSSLQGEMRGSFNYQPSPECADACAALGYYNNLPADYCPGTNVWQTVKRCSAALPALQQIQNNKLHSAWCASAKISTGITIDYKTPKRTRDQTTPDILKACSDSYNQKCFNATLGQKSDARRAFDQCCGQCFLAVASSTCHWTVDASGAESAQGSFPYYGSQCFETCDAINDVKQASDLCGNKMVNMVSKCLAAVEVREVMKNNDWCKHHGR